MAKSFGKLLAGTAMALALAGGTASATTLTFGFNGTGNYTFNTGDITALTTTKTIPAIELVNTIPGPALNTTNAALAGIALASPVSLSTLTLATANGPDVFTLSVGLLTMSFTSVSGVSIIPSGANSQGAISEQFNGTITGDTSVGQIFLGQTVSISESCTQVSIGNTANCSDTVTTPGIPTQTPEPASLVLIGSGLFGLGLLRFRRR